MWWPGSSNGWPFPSRLLPNESTWAALNGLHAGRLAAEDQGGRWAACDPPKKDDLLGQLRLRGPHDLRHTFATWLEDAGVPARVIDELMGHANGRRGGGAPSHEGSLIGNRYRWTTPDMEARVVAAIEQRLAISFAVAALGVNLDRPGPSNLTRQA